MRQREDLSGLGYFDEDRIEAGIEADEGRQVVAGSLSDMRLAPARGQRKARHNGWHEALHKSGEDG